MQNGKNAVLEQLQILGGIDANWELILLEEEGAANDEVQKKIRLLVTLLRQELKTVDETEIRNYLSEEGIGKEAVDKLLGDAREMLQLYTGFAALREWEAKSSIELKGILDVIYQKYIVRYEPGCLEQLKNEVCDRERLRKLAEQMDYLTDYYVSRSYTRKKIVQDLQDETGLLEENCEYWADLIEKDYMALKMNYIVNNIERIQMSLRRA